MAHEKIGIEAERPPQLQNLLNAADKAELVLEHDPGEEPEPETEAEPEPEAGMSREAMVSTLTFAMSALFAAIAKRKGDHWALDAAEAKGLAEPLVDVLDEIGVVVEGPWERLAIAAAIVVVPRLKPADDASS